MAQPCPQCGKVPEDTSVERFGRSDPRTTAPRWEWALDKPKRLVPVPFIDALKGAIDRPDFWEAGRVPALRPDEV